MLQAYVYMILTCYRARRGGEERNLLITHIPLTAIYAIYAFAIPYLAGTGMRSEPSLGCARGYSGPSRSKV